LEPVSWFFSWLADSSLQACVLIVLVVAVQGIFRSRMAPRWRYGLWLLLVVRLGMPWAPESRISIYNLLPFKQSVSALFGEGDAVGANAMPSVLAGSSWDGDILREPLAPFPGSYRVGEHGEESRIMPLQSPEIPHSSGGMSHAATQAAGGGPFRPSPVRLISLIWLVGALVLGVYVLAQSLTLVFTVRRQRPVTEPRMLNLLEDCKAEMRVHTILGVVETPQVPGPALFGFIRPRLLLPLGTGETLEPSRLRHIFLHELAHLKRHDVALNWLVTLLQVLHWFNPLVWYAFHRMRSEREMACDGLALSRVRPGEAPEYGRTILRILERSSQPFRLPCMSGIVENRAQIKRRIAMIAKQDKRSSCSSALAVALLIAVGGLALTNRQDALAKERNPSRSAASADIRNEDGRNKHDDWVYFESKETAGGRAGRLVLQFEDGRKVVLVSEDTVLISYLADSAWGSHQNLAISMSDTNRALFALPLEDLPPEKSLEKAELVLNMKLSRTPPAEPFDLAAHVVADEWHEGSTTWNNQPEFQQKAELVVTIKPEPGTVQLDVTDVVRKWRTGEAPNHGILLKIASPVYRDPWDGISDPRGKFTEKMVREKDVDSLFHRMPHGEIGYQWHAGLWALIAKARTGDAQMKDAIINRAVEMLEDTSRFSYQRYCCCFLLSGIGDERALPVLKTILLKDEDASVREGAARALGEFDGSAARETLAQAAEAESQQRVLRTIRKALNGDYDTDDDERVYTSSEPVAGSPPLDGNEKYDSGEVSQTDAELFFQRIDRPPAGYHQFSSLWALIEKGKAGDPGITKEIVSRAGDIILDQSENMFRRWQCCYVLSGIGDESGIPTLAEALREDPDQTVRGVAACALGEFNTPAAREALEEAAKHEPSEEVRDWVRKALAGEFAHHRTN